MFKDNLIISLLIITNLLVYIILDSLIGVPLSDLVNIISLALSFILVNIHKNLFSFVLPVLINLSALSWNAICFYNYCNFEEENFITKLNLAEVERGVPLFLNNFQGRLIMDGRLESFYSLAIDDLSMTGKSEYVVKYIFLKKGNEGISGTGLWNPHNSVLVLSKHYTFILHKEKNNVLLIGDTNVKGTLYAQ